MSRFTLKPISKYQDELAATFSESCIATNVAEYARRDQSDVNKIAYDIYNGKVAEYMVFNHLLKNGKSATPPDVMIYEKNEKSFDADITSGEIQIHVKSCQADTPFGHSWVFQPQDSLVSNPTENDFLALCVIGEESYMYLVKAMDMDFNTPIKSNLNKKVIYEDFVKTYTHMKKNKVI